MKTALAYSPLLLNAVQSGAALWGAIEPTPTVVISSYCEVDCYAAGVMAAIPNEVLRIKSVMVKTQTIPQAGEAGYVVSSYTCKEKDAAQAIIVNAFNQNDSVLRTLIFQAADMDIPLEKCFILAPKMKASLYKSICNEFAFPFDMRGINIASDTDVDGWCLQHTPRGGMPYSVLNLVMDGTG